MVSQIISSQSMHLIWLLVGLSGLGLGMFIGEPSIIALAIAALITAIVAVSIPSVTIQVLLWGVLAISLAIVMRGLEPRQSKDLAPPSTAIVSELIPAGDAGHVHYGGSIWKARCQVSDVTIAVGESVFVVGRQSNTLIVLPATFPESLDNPTGLPIQAPVRDRKV